MHIDCDRHVKALFSLEIFKTAFWREVHEGHSFLHRGLSYITFRQLTSVSVRERG